MIIIIFAPPLPRATMASSETVTKKERSHQRIVESAARLLRRAGFDGVGVAEVMREAGLTHGGFYAHFPSREALLAEALDHGARESMALFEEVSQAPSTHAIDLLLDRYLSDAHAEYPERGCTLAALATETRRQSPEVRGVATRRLRQALVLLQGRLRGTAAKKRDTAMAVLSTLVGALVLSRLVNDAELGRSLRAAAKRFVRSAAG
jgi:AcrR family transcriptional regulator